MKKNYKMLHGKGIDDSDYKTRIYKKGQPDWVCPYYSRWKNMINRCYCESYKKRNTKYYEVSVCDEWLLFSNFKSWMKTQKWEDLHLDKDLLAKDVLVYSPTTCCFITAALNGFLSLRNGKRSFPLGVSLSSNRQSYCADCNINNGNYTYLGTFKTPEEAHKAWQEAKYKRGIELLSEQTDPRVIAGMHKLLYNLAEDIRLGRETKKLSSNILKQTLDTTKTNT